MIKPIIFSALLPIVFAGCTSTNPKAAFDDVNKTVNARTGQSVQCRVAIHQAMKLRR